MFGLIKDVVEIVKVPVKTVGLAAGIVTAPIAGVAKEINDEIDEAEKELR